MGKFRPATVRTLAFRDAHRTERIQRPDTERALRPFNIHTDFDTDFDWGLKQMPSVWLLFQMIERDHHLGGKGMTCPWIRQGDRSCLKRLRLGDRLEIGLERRTLFIVQSNFGVLRTGLSSSSLSGFWASSTLDWAQALRGHLGMESTSLEPK